MECLTEDLEAAKNKCNDLKQQLQDAQEKEAKLIRLEIQIQEMEREVKSVELISQNFAFEKRALTE